MELWYRLHNSVHQLSKVTGSIDLVEQAKLNLESDYLIVQFIYEYSRVKSISYIVMGQRGWA